MNVTCVRNPQAISNRLACEKSPYLLQHAHNPVDWYPWGEEAFSKARGENKPIFLSVGYATCHWCHVMAHESFEKAEIAQYMNRNFVSIKVDREERPDIDRLFMAYVQTVTQGGGGWPMSVWLTPDLKPFYGGTYFPPEDGYGRSGFLRVLESLAAAWRTARLQIESAGTAAISQLQAHALESGPDAEIDIINVLDHAVADFKASYDTLDGGFGDAPKFPRPSVYAFLLRHHARVGGQQSLDMVIHTLRSLANGGIHDHLGGGFHRYATDAHWLVPHFEKMLYDQAQLSCAYLEAYQVTGELFFVDMVRDILNYVRRDLTGPDGQFCSAEDADSPVKGQLDETVEGAFYTWTESEVRGLLGDEEGRRFGAAMGLDRLDNLVDKRHVLAVSSAGARDLLAKHRDALLAARAKRPRPYLDDKVLTAWNGLMISAFARAYQILGIDIYRESAERAATFVRQHLYASATGRLYRRYREGEAAVDGYAEDYAFLIQGLLDLYEADFDPVHLEWAITLQKMLDAFFWDTKKGGYFSSAIDASDILVRMKEMHDGAEPSANSVAAHNLLRLGTITGAAEPRNRATRLFQLFDGD